MENAPGSPIVALEAVFWSTPAECSGDGVFEGHRDFLEALGTFESGVALRFPPHSIRTAFSRSMASLPSVAPKSPQGNAGSIERSVTSALYAFSRGQLWITPAERSDDGVFEGHRDFLEALGRFESGVALRFPPHSRMTAR